jgi:hypothetical protein
LEQRGLKKHLSVVSLDALYESTRHVNILGMILRNLRQRLLDSIGALQLLAGTLLGSRLPLRCLSIPEISQRCSGLSTGGGGDRILDKLSLQRLGAGILDGG